MTLIRFSQPVRPAFTILGLSLCAAALTGRDWGRWTPPTLLALGVLVLATRLLVLRPPRRAAIWDDGFALLEGATVAHRFSHAQVASLRVDEHVRAVLIVARDADPLTEIPLEFFGSVAHAEAFVAAVRDRLAQE